MRQKSGLPASHIGKLCGVSASQVYAWERGTGQPTTSEALRWLTVLHEQTPRQAVISARSLAAAAEKAEAEQAKEAEAQAAVEASW